MTKLNWSATDDTVANAISGASDGGVHLLDQIRQQCERGYKLDARQILAEHPELVPRKSVVLDLAYEEYCQREEAGEQLDIDQFCDCFPDYRTSVRRRLEVHRFVQIDGPNHRTKVQWPQVGETFCGFILQEIIGEGAIGRVYLAREPALGNRTVVLKVSREGGSEAQLLGQLAHRHVVPVHSVKEDEISGLTTVCMPFLGMATFEDVLDETARLGFVNVRGSVLSATLRRLNQRSGAVAGTMLDSFDRMQWTDAVLHQMADVADALAYLHNKQILHRDLKPSNILLADDGRAMLLDFNLSADLSSQAHRLGGTLPYMAPEHVQAMLGDDDRSPDNRSDIYALGVIFYQLLTGVLPFGDLPKNVPIGQAGRRLLENQRDPQIWAALERMRVGRPVINIVKKCLQFEPTRRFQTASELAISLRNSSRPVNRLRRWAKRRPLIAGGATLLTVSTIITIAFLLATYQPADIRLYQQGLAALQAADYEGAVTALQESRLLNPHSIDSLSALARARFDQGSYLLAYDLYHELSERTGDGAIWVNMAYCKNKLYDRSGAIGCYFEAINRGVVNTTVLNNLGRTYLEQNNIRFAVKYLDQALELDPNLKPALLTRAQVELTRAVLPRENRLVSDQSLADIEKVIALGADNQQIRYTAAALWNLSDREIRLDKIFEHVGRAVELGSDPQQFRVDPLLRVLKDDPRMKAALSRPRTHEVATPYEPLIAPATFIQKN